jgi:hypothetical protein
LDQAEQEFRRVYGGEEDPQKFKDVRRERKPESMSTDPYVSIVGADMASQFMFTTLFRIVSEMGDNPSQFLAEVRIALLDLTATYKLPPMATAQEEAIREHAKAIITGVLATAGAARSH